MKKTIFPALLVIFSLQSFAQGITVKRIQDMPSDSHIDTSSVTLCIDDSLSPSHSWAYRKVSFGQIARQFGASPVAASCDTLIIDTITSSQILNSYTSPVTLLPAPGAGWQWNVLSVIAHYDSVSTNYTVLSYPFSGSGLFIGDISKMIWQPITSPMGIPSSTGTENLALGSQWQSPTRYNKPMVFYTQGANPTGGDGILVITIIARKTH